MSQAGLTEDSMPRTGSSLSLRGDGALYAGLKRLIDLGVAVTILVLGSPLWLFIAAAIKVYSPGPALYVVEREIGQNGRPFRYYKFRSMHVKRDEAVHREAYGRYMRGEPLGEVVDRRGNRRPVYKIVKDDRIHGLGRVLRKTGVDEIPQLINVLRGEMSLIGPRPAIGYEWDMYEERHRARLSVKPGISGYHQVYGRANTGFEGMYRADMEYIAKRSLGLDLKLMLLTPWVMLTGKGAH